MAPIPPPSSAVDRASSSISQVMPSLTKLIKRQSPIPAVIPTQYSSLDSMSPGSIVGIVLGSVAGFLLLLLLIYTLLGGTLGSGRAEEEIVVRQRTKSRRTSSRRSSRTEPRIIPVVERERVIVQERRESRPPPVIVDSSVGSDDEVVVIEDHSPPRRARSKKDTGYRTVDPMAYGGGDRPFREVDRRGSRGSRRSGN